MAEQKKTISDAEFAKLTLDEKIKARENNQLTETQADQLEAEEDAKYHLDMLAKQSGTRVPAGLRVLRSIGDLGLHNPTPAQQKQICDTIDAAVKEMKESMAGKPKVGFQLSI